MCCRYDRCISDGYKALGIIIQRVPDFIVMTRERYLFRQRQWKSVDDDDRGISLLGQILDTAERVSKTIDRRLQPEYTSFLVISYDRRSRCWASLHIILHHTSHGSNLSDVTNLPSAAPNTARKQRRPHGKKLSAFTALPKTRVVNRTIAKYDAFYLPRSSFLCSCKCKWKQMAKVSLTR